MKKGRGFNAYCARYDADDLRATGAEGPPTQEVGSARRMHIRSIRFDGGDDDDDDDDVGRVAQRCATMRERV